MIANKRILILGAHVDDPMIGCGGLIARYSGMADIHVAVFSSSTESTIEAGFLPATLIQEFYSSARILGIDDSKIMLFDYQTRNFPETRQSILDTIIGIRKEVSPDIVMCSGTGDVHQDHATVRDEAIRAFRSACILGYEIPRNNIKPFNYDMYVVLEEKHIDIKAAGVDIYATQQHRMRYSDIARASAKLRGADIGKEYAEAFEVMRWIM